MYKGEEFFEGNLFVRNEQNICETGVRKLYFRITGCKPVHLKNRFISIGANWFALRRLYNRIRKNNPPAVCETPLCESIRTYMLLAAHWGYLQVWIDSHRGVYTNGCAKIIPRRFAKLCCANQFAPTCCWQRIEVTCRCELIRIEAFIQTDTQK